MNKLFKSPFVYLFISLILFSCSEESTKSSTSNPSIDKEETEEINHKEQTAESMDTTLPLTQMDTATEIVQTETNEFVDEPPAIEIIEDTEDEYVEQLVTYDPPTETATEESIETPVFVQIKPSHHEFDQLLNTYVSSTGKVNYSGLKSKKDVLQNYLKDLKNFPPAENWTKNEKLAYWINLYNASTIMLILDNYPVSSITKISGGKPWDKRFVKSGSKTYTLNEVENEIIRPRFKEPRIHMAVNCAAKSCPSLMNAAFTASKLEQQLEKQTKAFINNTQFNTIKNGSLQLSKIFEWYAADFGGENGIRKFVKKYSNISFKDNAKISYIEYNWDLNK